MLKARQEAHFQRMNYQVILMRGREVSYFVKSINSVSKQAAILACFSVMSVTNIRELEDSKYYSKMTFFIFIALVFVSAIHCIITGMFVVVYGSGLAIRGPVGSMARAVEGLIIETNAIMTSYLMTVFCLAVSILGFLFSVVYDETSMICVVIILLAMVYWYDHCVKMYNRFQYDPPDNSWEEVDDCDMEDVYPLLQYLHKRGFADDVTRNLLHLEEGTSNDDKIRINKEGYLTVRHSQPSEVKLDQQINGEATNVDEWRRKYVVLVGSSVFQYDSEADFEATAVKALRKRPIKLAGYSLSVSRASSKNFLITLRPLDPLDERRQWELKCDTADEFSEWTTFLAEGLLLAQAEIRERGTNPESEKFLVIE